VTRSEAIWVSIAMPLAMGISWAAPGSTEALSLAVILVFGMPHGAADSIQLRSLLGVGPKLWAGFGGYLLIALIVVALWLLWPVLGLAVFLVISALHFGGTDSPEDSRPWALIHGTATLAAPFVFHAQEALNYLSWLGLPQLPESTVKLVAAVQIAGAVACLTWRDLTLKSSKPWATLGFVAGLAPLLFLAPAPGFAVYFCLLHGPRHLRRLRQLEIISGDRRQGRQIVVTTAMALILLACLYLLLPEVNANSRLLQTVVIGIAALTVPHMLLDALMTKNWRPPNRGDLPQRSSVK
jgi:beta-carotene 15,15'-dioxygenase